MKTDDDIRAVSRKAREALTRTNDVLVRLERAEYQTSRRMAHAVQRVRTLEDAITPALVALELLAQELGI